MIVRRCTLVLVTALSCTVAAAGVAAPASEAARRPARAYDVNGDGYTDLVVGVPGQRTGKVAGGAVTVLLDGPGGVRSRGSQLLSQATKGVVGVPADGAGFGSTVASGDFDGDGYADVVVGVPGTWGSFGYGAVELLRGSPHGLTGRGSRLWHEPGSLTDWDELLVPFGTALAAADFNRDGYADLAVGAPTANGKSFAAGAVVLYYGSRRGLRLSAPQIWTQGSKGVPGDPGLPPGVCANANPDECNAHNQFGRALAVGDFDGNGYPDLAVGTPGYSLSLTKEDVGAVNIFSGSRHGLVPTMQFWTQDTPGILDQAESWVPDPGGETPIIGDEFGATLTAGDFNGDRRSDLAVGVPQEHLNERPCVVDGHPCFDGIVQVIYGSTRGLTARGNQRFTSSLPRSGLTPLARFGSTLAAAAFAGHGVADLVVGTPGFGPGGNAGAVEVLRGSRAAGLTSQGRRAFVQGVHGVRGAAEAGDAFGTSLAAGRVGRGHAYDLAVGVPGENGGKGVVQIFRGGGSGLTAAGDTIWSQSTLGLPGLARPNAFFGGALGSA